MYCAGASSCCVVLCMWKRDLAVLQYFNSVMAVSVQRLFHAVPCV